MLSFGNASSLRIVQTPSDAGPSIAFTGALRTTLKVSSVSFTVSPFTATVIV